MFSNHIICIFFSTFRKEVIEKMIEKTQQTDGICFETFRRLQGYAKK